MQLREVTRSMFLNIIPKNLKNEIFRENNLTGADHIRPAWFGTLKEDLSLGRLHTEVLGQLSEPSFDLAIELKQCIVDNLPKTM